MDSRSRACEASLLYTEAPGFTGRTLASLLRDELTDNDVTLLSVEDEAGVFTILRGDRADVLIAQVGEPLPLDHFASVGRPAGTDIDETLMLGRLARHRSCLTVLVIDPERTGPQRPALEDGGRAALCRAILTALSEVSAPDLLFWNQTDTLYAAEELAETAEPVFGPAPRAAPKAIEAGPAVLRLPAPARPRIRVEEFLSMRNMSLSMVSATVALSTWPHLVG